MIRRSMRNNCSTFTAGRQTAGVSVPTTWFKRLDRHFANRFTLCCLMALAQPGVGRAGELDVSVFDRAGRMVDDVAVTASPLVARGPAFGAPAAVMDQRHRAFFPRLLVVPVGTKVEFPNNDTVSHQVYSFSPSKKFQLSLYKGEVHAPVTFERAGLVVLGCNIHDDMVGYIFVTDSPFFGKTSGGGALKFTGLPEGDYRVTIWSPFIADSPEALTRTVHIAAEGVTFDRWNLSRDLHAQPEPRPRRNDWEY